jgi:UDP-N-acetylglucosamine 2-epimerase (non-hydrolysing)
MPEKINRLVTDVLADMLWTPSTDASHNLLNEGIAQDKIRFVGNMHDRFVRDVREKIEGLAEYHAFGLRAGTYGIVTMHRPSNVDSPLGLKKICMALIEIAEKIPLVFPVHSRTRKQMEEHRLLPLMERSKNLAMPEPLGYVRFMSLILNCRFVITDSGGLQEETSYLGIPCLTVRKNTERPVTITHGTNQLCDLDQLTRKASEVLVAPSVGKKEIKYWDGNTAARIVEVLRTYRVTVNPQKAKVVNE